MALVKKYKDTVFQGYIFHDTGSDVADVQRYTRSHMHVDMNADWAASISLIVGSVLLR
jgi:hypothetical protein